MNMNQTNCLFNIWTLYLLYAENILEFYHLGVLVWNEFEGGKEDNDNDGDDDDGDDDEEEAEKGKEEDAVAADAGADDGGGGGR